MALTLIRQPIQISITISGVLIDMLRLSICLCLFAGCNRQPPPTPVSGPPPASEKPKVEAELAKTTLSARLAKSLGIATTPARIRPVQDSLRLSGLIVPPIGSEATITAPLAGVVKLPPNGALPIPGRHVDEGQVLFILEPVLSPVEAIQLATLKRSVENEKAKALEAERSAKAEYERVADLKKDGLRGQQDVDQAQAKIASAAEDVKSANAKLEAFKDAPREVKSTLSGTLMTVLVTPGQTVTQAAPLATVADLSQLWIRVAAPEADLARINRGQSVTVEVKSTGTSGTPLSKQLLEAEFEALVPQVDPVKHTADIYYALMPAAPEQLLIQAIYQLDIVGWSGARPKGMTTSFVRDQMVTVAVPVDEKRSECVVPISSVIYDAYGNAWVYVEQPSSEKTTNAYERRRVELGPITSDGVVVRPSLKDGDRVVSAGAGALFSREFSNAPAKTTDE